MVARNRNGITNIYTTATHNCDRTKFGRGWGYRYDYGGPSLSIRYLPNSIRWCEYDYYWWCNRGICLMVSHGHCCTNSPRSSNWFKYYCGHNGGHISGCWHSDNTYNRTKCTKSRTKRNHGTVQRRYIYQYLGCNGLKHDYLRRSNECANLRIAHTLS